MVHGPEPTPTAQEPTSSPKVQMSRAKLPTNIWILGVGIFMSDLILNIDQLSVFLGIPKATIYYKVSRNEIPSFKVGKHLRFDLSEVIEFFKNQSSLDRSLGSSFKVSEKKFFQRSLTTKNTDRADPSNKGD